jgi:hypothetical protein
MAALFAELGRRWCRVMHQRLLWPIHGQYECSVCLRRFAVPWSNSPEYSLSSCVRPLERSVQGSSSRDGRVGIGRRSAAA